MSIVQLISNLLEIYGLVDDDRSQGLVGYFVIRLSCNTKLCLIVPTV